MKHVALIGAGNMGYAMLRSWTALTDYRFSVSEPNVELLSRAIEAGAAPLDANAENVASDIDIMVVATKPQMVAEVLKAFRGRLKDGSLVISVAAGVRIELMARSLDRDVAIIRAMPNTPAAIGAGMTVCCPNLRASEELYRAAATELLSTTGRVAFVMDEAQMDAVTAVSGSGPAYVFHFIEALRDAAVDVGLDDDLAMLLAQQTVFGAAKLASQSSETPTRLREQVTSPNGTTAAALNVLMDRESGLAQLMRRAVEAARNRSVELGN